MKASLSSRSGLPRSILTNMHQDRPGLTPSSSTKPHGEGLEHGVRPVSGLVPALPAKSSTHEEFSQPRPSLSLPGDMGIAADHRHIEPDVRTVQVCR